jgi:aminoglycoside/choline kinase family phosphotransferase
MPNSDGKQHYLAHLPRVIGLLDRALHTPALLPLREFLDRHLPGWPQPLPAH